MESLNRRNASFRESTNSLRIMLQKQEGKVCNVMLQAYAYTCLGKHKCLLLVVANTCVYKHYSLF